MDIDCLPDEILLMIINKLTHTELLTSSFVCHKWYELLTADIVRTTRFRIDLQSFLHTTRCYKSFKLTDLSASMMSDQMFASITTAEDIWLLHCHIDSPSIFWDHIARSCDNLKKITINYSDCRGITDKRLVTSKLPKCHVKLRIGDITLLQTLPVGIQSLGLVIEEFMLIHRWDYETALQFIEKHLPNQLKDLTMNCYHFSDRSPSFMNTVFQRLNRMAELKLRTLKLCYSSPKKEWNNLNALLDFDVFVSFVVAHQGSLAKLKLYPVIEKVHFDTISIYLSRLAKLTLGIGNNSDGLSIMKSLNRLEKCENLAYLTISLTIDANKATNAAELGNLSRLRRLECLTFEHGLPGKPTFELKLSDDFQCVPSLKYLGVYSMCIAPQTLDHICRLLPNLTDLSLSALKISADCSANLYALQMLSKLDSLGIEATVLDTCASNVEMPGLKHLKFLENRCEDEVISENGLRLIAQSYPLVNEIYGRKDVVYKRTVDRLGFCSTVT